MKPVDFPQANCSLCRKLENGEEAEWHPARVYYGEDETGNKCFVSCFELSSEDLLRIIETKRVFVTVMGDVQPAMGMQVSNPWQEGHKK